MSLRTVPIRRAGNRHNLFVVAVSIGMGMIPMIANSFDQWLPASTKVLTHSGILLAALACQFVIDGILESGIVNT